MLEVRVAANCDDVAISWRTDPGAADTKLAGCLGFAIQRREGAKDPVWLETSMPFDGQTATAGEHHPSTVWPIQRFVWTDHLAPADTPLTYRVAPVMGTSTAPSLPAESDWSVWSDPVSCSTGQSDGFSLFPNRGVVAAPWVTDEIDKLSLLPPNKGKQPGDLLADRDCRHGRGAP